MCKRPHRQIHKLHGFTLLEVIVALTLLTFGIAGALGAITACVHSVDAASEHSRATLLAQQVAAQLERSATLTAGNQTGTFDNLDANAGNTQSGAGSQAGSTDSRTTGYTWNADISAADDAGRYPVTITVQWAASKQYKLYTVLRPHTLQSAPAQSGNTGTGGTGNSPGGANGGGTGGTGGGNGGGTSGTPGGGSGGTGGGTGGGRGGGTPRPGGAT